MELMNAITASVTTSAKKTVTTAFPMFNLKKILMVNSGKYTEFGVNEVKHANGPLITYIISNINLIL